MRHWLYTWIVIAGIYMIGSICCSFSLAYTPSVRDIQTQQRIDVAIDVLSEHGKEKLVSVFAQVRTVRIPYKDNPRYLYMLEYILETVATHAQDDHEVSLTRESWKWNEQADTSWEEETPLTDITPDTSEEVIHSIATSTDVREFYEYYRGYLTDPTPISDLCTKYYPEIDQIAKEYDFPTALIIATRWREHTCIFSNPDNTWGNFQIISDYYAPGDITRDQFKQQIIDFINFSRAKRAWYDKIQVFGPEPVVLSYDRIDLLSLRKQAILYNGIAQGTTPETNMYANQNFGSPDNGRDGVVAMTLKAIWYGLSLEGNDTVLSVSKKNIDTESWKDEQEDREVTRCDDQFLVNLTPGDESVAVKEMQLFLKQQWFFSADATGYYGDLTTQAVNAFQVFYKADILDPGGYSAPTDQRYPATRKKANNIACW